MNRTSPDALVFGGGPAGLAAACEMAAAGCTVRIFHQESALGGPVHRYETDGAATPRAGAARRWQRLLNEMAGHGDRITLGLRTAFVGIDREGMCLLRDLESNVISTVRAPRVVFALGAVEQVPPVVGWQLPGVMTAGGLQLLVKRDVPLPGKRIVLAGSGPLLLALGAQMAKRGHPPLAILEAGRPFRVGIAGLGMLEGPEYIAEAFQHRSALWTARVPYRTGIQVSAVTRTAEGFTVTARRPSDGSQVTLDADLVALHNGLVPNDNGLPHSGLHPSGVAIRYAGDCYDVLGGRAAIVDGRMAGRSLVRDLRSAPADLEDRLEKGDRTLTRYQRLQRTITRLFDASWPAPSEWPDELVLCRCENRTMGDMRALYQGRTPSPKEVKLVGRFAMGECQGRLCERQVLRAIEDLEGIHYPVKTLVGDRWPVRPTPVSAFLADGGPSPSAPPETRAESERQP